MPLRKTPYTNHQVNLYNRSQDSVKPNIQQTPKRVFVSEEIQEPEITRQKEKPQKVSSNNESYYTPRIMKQEIDLEYPQIISACNIDETVFLAKLKTLLAIFIGEGSHKWNFFTVEHTTKLQPGVDTYELPENYDQMISVSLEPDCSLNPYTDKPIELTYLDYQKSSFPYGSNYYSIRNNRITFHNDRIQKALQKCNHCGKCNNCIKYKGNVKLRYHITAPIPKSMDESMVWMSQHAYYYIKAKITIELYSLADQVPPETLIQQASDLFHNLQSWDSNLAPIENKQNNNRRFFDFQGVLV
jgi:hypothetical protein